MKTFFSILLIICSASVSAQLFTECVTIENDLQYLSQHAPASGTELTGYVEGGRLTHHYCCGNLGFTDLLYSGHGVLTGEDAYDDDVKVQFTEYNGEFRLTYMIGYTKFNLSPFIGWGIRQLRNKKTAPNDLLLETTYQYLPLGVRFNFLYGPFINFGGHVKADIITFSKWKYNHPLIHESSRELEKCPCYEGKIWMCYLLSLQWRGVIGGSFRYIDLRYPDDVAFSPEPKRYYDYGFQTGFQYHY